ncbi:MAG TPA: lysylphosphatidylglycerol synthase transmembrane domain-containing protein [Ktedonobacterales bacterium]
MPQLSDETTSETHETHETQASQQQAKRGALGAVMGLFKRYKRVVQAVMLLVIVGSVAALISKEWAKLATYDWHLSWGLLVAGFALLVAQELSFAFIWRSILARMGSRLDIVSSQRIYLGAEFVRYIPGNVWHVITRVLWAEQRGVPKTIGFASMVVELATKIVSAALVFAVSLLFWPDTSALTAQVDIPRGVLVTAGAVLLPLLLLGLYPPVLRGVLNFGLKKLGREPVQFALSYRDMLLITLYWSLSWVVAGVGFYLLVRSIVATPLAVSLTTGLVLAAGIYALGWDVGFLSFITPSGVGFREAALVILLTTSLLPVTGNVALATVIAIVARLLATGAELVCIAAAYLVRGTPLLSREELAKRAQRTPATPQTETR